MRPEIERSRAVFFFPVIPDLIRNPIEKKWDGFRLYGRNDIIQRL
jgi:hypothetical protein